MFTGIVEEVGRIVDVEHLGRGPDDAHARLHVACDEAVRDARTGDSIAVAGCCLTVSRLGVETDGTARAGFGADLMAATLETTSLGSLGPGSPVNLERAMRADGRFGGHLVQGHVDGVGEVVARDEQPGTVFLTVRAPGALASYLVAKGSVTVDGTSLTIVDVTTAGRDHDVDGATFRVGLIPHTLEVTTFGERAVGDPVNLEVDVVAKYVERLLAAGRATPYEEG